MIPNDGNTVPFETSLVKTLSGLVPDNVAVAGGDIDQVGGKLFAEEEAAVTQATPKRRAEFTAGRLYARAALRKLGISDQAIPRASDRRPLWPAGAVGSISHSGSHCAAIAASRGSYAGLGLDLDSIWPLSAELHALVAHPSERKDFDCPVDMAMGPIDRGKLVFSIKETLFKAIYPATRRWFDFHDAVVTVSPTGSFAARLLVDLPGLEGNGCVGGHWAKIGDQVLSVLVIRSAVIDG